VLLLAACENPHSALPTAPSRTSTLSNVSSLPLVSLTGAAVPVNYALTIDGCSNSPGPQITLSGTAALAGFGVDMLFSNNLKDTHTYTVDKDVETVLQPAGTDIVIPKQPVLGGVGGNPFIWVQFIDASGAPASDAIFVGRCVQGSRLDFASAQDPRADVSADFAVSECNNNPGPFISMDADMAFEGLGMQMIFSNNVKLTHSAVRSQTMTILPAGMDFSFPKQPVLGGVGGNPWIFAAFTDGNGTAFGDPVLLGRCVQLSQTT